jgi:hypothetical protein
MVSKTYLKYCDIIL